MKITILIFYMMAALVLLFAIAFGIVAYVL